MVISESMTFNQSTADNLNPTDNTIPVLKKTDETIRVEEGPTKISSSYIGHSRIYGHATNGVYGAPALGVDGVQVVYGDAGRVTAVVRVVGPNMTHKERFYFTHFRNTGGTSMTWDTTLHRLY